MESTTISVAALQFSPRLADVEYNLSRMQELVGDDAWELLVLPELASTGYFFTDRDELLPLAEQPNSGAYCGWMRNLAASRNMVVVGGFAERDDENRLYNSALIALPDGSHRVYRKTHLFYKEQFVFERGDTGFFSVEWDGVVYGTMICYDWRFPESARSLALAGADIIAHPSNLVATKDVWGPSMCTRALENKVIAVTANRSGAEERGGETLRFSGASQITDMNGRPIIEAGPDVECVISADVRPFATRRKSFNEYNDIFVDRRPEMYRVDVDVAHR